MLSLFPTRCAYKCGCIPAYRIGQWRTFLSWLSRLFVPDDKKVFPSHLQAYWRRAHIRTPPISARRTVPSLINSRVTRVAAKRANLDVIYGAIYSQTRSMKIILNTTISLTHRLFFRFSTFNSHV